MNELADFLDGRWVFYYYDKKQETAK